MGRGAQRLPSIEHRGGITIVRLLVSRNAARVFGRPCPWRVPGKNEGHPEVA